MNTDLMFSTGKDDWATPPALFDALEREFGGFALDAAALEHNRKAFAYFGPDHPDESRQDALAVPSWWLAMPIADRGPIWINPPYSRGLQGRFVHKAALEASMMGATVVMLLPARTDTKVFHADIWDASAHKPRPWVREVRFLPGRVRFVGAPASAPFPSMIVVFQL
jgi:phage N-6-adenine-methyltransferase